MPSSDLSDLEREVLAFERLTWTYRGSKEQAVRDRFDLTATEYYRRLNLLIDRPEALAHAPVVVNRLRQLRHERQRRRSARRAA